MARLEVLRFSHDFIAEDEGMLQELNDLARSRKIPSISHFISAATRQHYETKRKEFEG